VNKKIRKEPLSHSKWLFIVLFICVFIIFLITMFAFFQNINQSRRQYSYEIIPEYDRTMEKIVISLPTRNSLVPALSLDSHFQVLQYIPNYTQVMIILPEDRMEEIRTRFKTHPIQNKTMLRPFKIKTLDKGQFYLIFAENEKLVNSGLMENITIPKGTVWAQDLFEPAKLSNGKNLLLMPETYKMFYSDQGNDKEDTVNVQPDNLFLKRLLSENIDGLRTPLIFMGGNVLVDRINGIKIAFCGGDVFKDTQIVWRAYYEEKLNKEDFSEMVKNYLKVDKVYIIGREDKPQPSYMFHLDQTMILLPDGIAGVTNIIGTEPKQNIKDINEIKSFLLETKSLLKKIGYKLIEIDTSIDGVLNHQFYINSIPYIDKVTGQRKLLMPVSIQKPTTEEKALIGKNISSFRSAGYDVVTVPSESTDFNGGIHCLINVIE